MGTDENKTAFETAADAKGERIRRTRAIRSFCYRMKQNGAPTKGDKWEQSMKIIIEGLEGFDSWPNFGETWDLNRDEMLKDKEYLEVTPLMFSIGEMWEGEVRQHARSLPTKNAPRKLQLP